MAGHEMNQIKEWAEILKDPSVEITALWQYGDSAVGCAITSCKGAKVFRIDDPDNPIDSMVTEDFV